MLERQRPDLQRRRIPAKTGGVLSGEVEASDNCTHECSEESGCIVKVLNCGHVHDESCGCAEAQPCGYECKICPVQELIDALPGAEEITEENAEEVKAKLTAIDEAKAELTDEELETLDVSRYMAAVEALTALEGQEKENVPETTALTGSGTETDPFIVTTAEDWVALCSKNNGMLKYYIKLDADIDLSGVTWSWPAFYSGELDGQGHSIRGLTKPLFIEIRNAEVRNLSLLDVNIQATASMGYTGALARSVSATDSQGPVVIENCYVTGTITNSAYAAGGLVGQVAKETTIRNCVVNAEVSSTGTNKNNSTAGGLVGLVSVTNKLTIDSCIAMGTVSTGAGRGAGGLIGGIGVYNGIVAIKNSAALQSSITTDSSGTYAGKLYGCYHMKLSDDSGNNYAYDGMEGGYEGSFTTTYPEMHGDGVSGAACTTADFWNSTIGWSENDNWGITDGRLPILKTTNGSALAGMTGEPPLYLAKQYTISGTVSDLEGTGISNASLSFTSDSGTVITGVTGEDGSYTVSLSAGDYDVTVQAAGYLTEKSKATVSGDASGNNFQLQKNPVSMGTDTTAAVVFSTTDGAELVGSDTVSIVYNGTEELDAADFSIFTGGDNSAVYEGVSVTAADGAKGTVSIGFAAGFDLISETARLFYKDSFVGEIQLTKTVNKVALAAPADPVWDAEVKGKAVWSAATNAAGYLVQLYKDGQALGEGISLSPDVTEYDFTSQIAESGSYTFQVKAVGNEIYADSKEAFSKAYEFAEQTLEDVRTAALAALKAMEVSNETKAEDVLKVVSGVITNKSITAKWSDTDGFTKKGASDGAAVGIDGSISGTIVLTQGTNTLELTVSLVISPKFSVTFTAGDADAVSGEEPLQENVTAGTKITLPSNPYTVYGKNFTGWSDGTKLYGANEEYTTPDTNVTLTAQWNEEVWDGSAAGTGLTGSGTEEEPYLITSCADLASMQGETFYTPGKYYRLMTDLDMGGQPFEPISAFCGFFDGNGYSIKNLNCSGGTLVYRGMFYRLGTEDNSAIPCVVKNLTLENASLSYDAYPNAKAGLLASGVYGNAVIQDCAVTGSITLGQRGDAVGGLIGRIENQSQNSQITVTIERCYAGVTVNGTAGTMGGLLGSGPSSGERDGSAIAVTIKDSYAVPAFSENSGNAAGLVGMGSGTTIVNSYATGEVLAVSSDSYSAAGAALYPKAVQNTVTIFPEIRGGNTSRLAGPASVSPILSGNYAYAGTMLRKTDKTAQEIDESTIGQAQKNGADVSAAELETQQFYEGLGWDFDNVWTMVSSSGYTYPVLKNQKSSTIPALTLDTTPVVESVTLSQDSATLPLGGSLQLKADVSVINGAARTVEWNSSGTGNGVTVSETGLVYVSENAAAGTYTITATSTADAGKFATCKITVDDGVYSLTYAHASTFNSPNAVGSFYASLEDAKAGTNPITTARYGVTVYMGFTGLDAGDILHQVEISYENGESFKAKNIDKYTASFVMPNGDVTATAGYAENLNAYNYVWFIGQEWSTWSDYTAKFETAEWSGTDRIGYLKVTDIVNGKLFDYFDIKSVSLYPEQSVTMTENTEITEEAGLSGLQLNEYCVLMDDNGFPTLYVKLSGPGTVAVDIKVKDDPEAEFQITQEQTGALYYTLDKTTAKAGETVTATLTDAGVERLKSAEGQKAVFTYGGGLLVVLFPGSFTENAEGKWTAAFTMPAQDVITYIRYTLKQNVTLNGEDATVSYNGQPQRIDEYITARIGDTDVSAALNGQYDVTYTGVDGTNYESTNPPAEVGTYSCTVKIPEGNTLYQSSDTVKVILTIQKSTPQAPAAPQASNRTENSITLAKPVNFADGTEIPAVYSLEYRCENGEWQTSPTFTGLKAGTSYSFYARIREDDNTNASAASAPGTIATLTAAPSAAEAKIDYRNETISYEDIYEMSTDSHFSSILSSGSSITDSIGKTLYIRVRASDGQAASAATPVMIPRRPAVPEAPVIDYRNETLTVADGCAYKIGDAQNESDGTGSAIDITGVIPNFGEEALNVVCYKKATDTSFRSEKAEMTIPARPETPGTPSAGEDEITGNSVTLTEAEGCEYKAGNGSWQEDTLFTALSPNTEYQFYQRVKATDHSFASLASQAAGITTKKLSLADVDVTVTGSYVYDGSAHFPAVEVTKDGITLTEGTDYTVSYTDGENNIVTRPINAGDYHVIIMAVADGSYTDSTSALFTIQKAKPQVRVPEGLTAEYGQTLSELTLTNPAGNMSGTWKWADEDSAVGSVGTQKHQVIFTPTDTANYSSAEFEVEVEVQDHVPPVGEITMGTSKWAGFLNQITFGLFFKDTQTVTITGQDNTDTEVTIAYVLAASEQIEEQLKAAEWTAYMDSFRVEPGKYVIYAKITDASQNTTVINSDGIVIYTDSERDTQSIRFTKFSTEDVTADVKLNGNTVAGITNGENALTNQDYSVDADGRITFTANYLNSLAAGSYVLTISYHPQGMTGSGVTDLSQTVIGLTVEKAVITDTDDKNDGNGGDNVNPSGGSGDTAKDQEKTEAETRYEGSVPATTAQGQTNASTGDSANAVLWVVLILLAGAGITGGVVYKKKRKH